MVIASSIDGRSGEPASVHTAMPGKRAGNASVSAPGGSAMTSTYAASASIAGSRSCEASSSRPTVTVRDRMVVAMVRRRYCCSSLRWPASRASTMNAASRVCPIDRSPVIEDRQAQDGIIRPDLDPAQRPQWPEAFYLIQHKTRHSYTLEAPSDFPLVVRVAALVTAVRTALDAI